MNEQKKVAVVILSWNGKKFLEQFLPSVIQHTSSELCEIIVADNCSTDDSVSFLKNKSIVDVNKCALQNIYSVFRYMKKNLGYTNAQIDLVVRGTLKTLALEEIYELESSRDKKI